jgi:hypothetical protein
MPFQSWHGICIIYISRIIYSAIGDTWAAVAYSPRIREMENRQRLMAALALAGMLAINAGFADEVVVTEALEAATISIDEVNRDLAKEANAVAAEKAAKSVLADTKLDLDIRLIGPTSVKIAGDR